MTIYLADRHMEGNRALVRFCRGYGHPGGLLGRIAVYCQDGTILRRGDGLKHQCLVVNARVDDLERYRPALADSDGQFSAGQSDGGADRLLCGGPGSKGVLAGCLTCLTFQSQLLATCFTGCCQQRQCRG